MQALKTLGIGAAQAVSGNLEFLPGAHPRFDMWNAGVIDRATDTRPSFHLMK